MKREFQRKIDGKWLTTYAKEDESVAKDLAQELLHKYVENAQYITRVTREQHFTHKTITVYYSKGMGGGRNVYTVDAHF